MKKILYAVLGFVALVGFSSCEEELPVYQDQQAKLNFKMTARDFTDDVVNDVNYTFVYESSDVVTDTVWVRVTTMGFLSKQARPVTIQQVSAGDGKLDATPGVHYKAFSEMNYCIEADSCAANLPIVFYRDASLENDIYYLYFQIVDNSDFTVGYEKYKERRYTVSDMMVKPAKWDRYYLHYYIGTYSKALHRFLIDITGKKWDDDYIVTAANDFNYLSYVANYAFEKLNELNAQRAAQGLDVLRDDDGNPVEISTYLLR